MTPAKLATYIRWKAAVDSNSPYADANLLPLVNMHKDNIAAKIAQLNPDYFEEQETAATVGDQYEYPRQTDTSNPPVLIWKRLDVSYDGTNFYPATKKTLSELSDYGEDWYKTNQPTDLPLVRFADTGYFLYPTPTSTTAGSARVKAFVVLRRTDLGNLTDDTGATDIEQTTGIGYSFHQLIGDLVVNEIKYKQGILTYTDYTKVSRDIMDVLVPAAFRELSTTSSSLPGDNRLQI